MKNPRTEAEWQEAANLARLSEMVESARAYGLIEGGPVINGGRCETILREAQRRGIHPLQQSQLIEKYLPAIAGREPRK